MNIVSIKGQGEGQPRGGGESLYPFLPQMLQVCCSVRTEQATGETPPPRRPPPAEHACAQSIGGPHPQIHNNTRHTPTNHTPGTYSPHVFTSHTHTPHLSTPHPSSSRCPYTCTPSGFPHRPPQQHHLPPSHISPQPRRNGRQNFLRQTIRFTPVTCNGFSGCGGHSRANALISAAGESLAVLFQRCL